MIDFIKKNSLVGVMVIMLAITFVGATTTNNEISYNENQNNVVINHK